MGIRNKVMTLKTNGLDAWQKFWFQEQSPVSIALFRIFFGFFVLQMSLMELLPNFLRFFGVKGIIDTASVSVYYWQTMPVFDVFLLMPQKDIYRWAFFFVFIVFAVFLTIGFRTRISATIVYLGLLSLDKHCPFLLDGGDQLMLIMSFLLIFSAAGQAYSVDRLLQARRQGCRPVDLPPVMVSPWAQRMMQVQISLAYFHAFLTKIVGTQWQEGTAVYYASQLTDFAKFSLPWLTGHSPGYQVLTYYTLFAELAMATLVWIKPIRYWILLGAALLHAGIDWTMNLPCFEWLFISSYINFVDPQDVEKFFAHCQSILRQAWAGVVLPSKTSEPKVTYSYAFMPIFLVLAIVLILGSFIANPLRRQFAVREARHNYAGRLLKAEDNWRNRLNKLTQMPDSNEARLTAQEALGVVLSLQKSYEEAGQLLRSVCHSRMQQDEAYNPELVRALSALANLYLETGHIKAAQLCYNTILHYDSSHLKNNQCRLSIDLNNLGVLYYFRALLNDNKSAQCLDLAQADTFFRQALNKLHNCEQFVGKSLCFNEADILSNRYLCLRELGCFNEAKIAKTEALRLNSGRTKLNLP